MLRSHVLNQANSTRLNACSALPYALLAFHCPLTSESPEQVDYDPAIFLSLVYFCRYDNLIIGAIFYLKSFYFFVGQKASWSPEYDIYQTLSTMDLPQPTFSICSKDPEIFQGWEISIAALFKRPGI